MLRWLKQHFSHANRWVGNIANWAAVAGLFFVGASVFMTWAANSITNISQYGWGAVVFAGVGAACIISLVTSLALVEWRYFHPLTHGNLVKEAIINEATTGGKTEERIYIANMFVTLRALSTDHYVSIGARCVNLSDHSITLQQQISGAIALVYKSQSFILLTPQFSGDTSNQTVAARAGFTITLIQLIPGEHVGRLSEILQAGEPIEFDLSNLWLQSVILSGETYTYQLWDNIR